MLTVATDWIGYRSRRRIWVGLALGITMLALTTWLANQPAATDCSDGTWLDSKGDVILASKVGVRTPSGAPFLLPRLLVYLEYF